MQSLALLVQAWQRVGATASRSAKIATLADCLRSVDAAQLELAVQYLSGELPQGRLGVSHATLQRASQLPAASCSSLTLSDVDERFGELSEVQGPGATGRRAQILGDLLGAADAEEQPFLRRLILGDLRAGALGGLMLEAIAAAARLPSAAVRRAAMYAPTLGAVAQAALSGGTAALQAFQLRTLSPLEPMLAQTASDVASALTRLGAQTAFEWKVDGARIQLHKRGKEVRIFTRRLNDVAASLPEIIELAQRLPAEELVLDGEVIALDANGRPRPFQQTMRRFGRKLDVAAMRERLPLHAYFFDCLRLAGDTMIERPERERFAALERAVPPENLIARLVGPDRAAAERFYLEALAAGHEGVMAKLLDAPMRRAAAARAGSRSSARTHSTWWCWRPSGAVDGARAGCRICIWARGCRARPGTRRGS